MRRVLYTILALSLIATTACTKTVYIPIEQRHKEVVFLRDTIIEIVRNGETHSNHTRDTTSTLQADGVYSQATITNGTLSHTLAIEPRRDSITIQVRELHTTDSIPYALPTTLTQTTAPHHYTYWLIIIAIATLSALSILIAIQGLKR